MKTCGFVSQINAYLDGELSGAKLRAFEEHLAACPRCREEAEQYRELLGELHGMGDREVPPMLQERLHAALSNEISKGDGRVKRKFKPWMLAPISAAVVCVLGVSVWLASGGLPRAGESHAPSLMRNAAQDYTDSEAQYGSIAAAPPMPMPAATAMAPAATYAADLNKAMEDRSAGEGFAGVSSAEKPSDTAQDVTGQKLIYTANIVTETREYDKCKAEIDSMLAGFGGYIGYSQENGVPEGYESTQGRSMTVALRIPVGKYADAMAELQAMGNLLQKYENTQDVGSQYVDTKARRDELVISRDKYMSLLDKADSTDSIIALQNAITDLTVRIEQDEAQLRYWDSQVSYSTITVEMREIVIPRSIATANPTSLGDRAGGAFYETLSGMKQGLEDFAVWFVGAIPWLCIIIVAAGVLLAVVLPKTRKARKAAKAAEAKKSEDKP
jgi:hypothetical protein